MDLYLKRLKHDCTIEEIHAYGLQVKRLISNPMALKALSASDLIWLQENRFIGGGYVSYKLSKEDAVSLCRDETQLMGLLFMAMESKPDPTVDLSQPMSANDLPFDFMHPKERDDPVKRKAYDDQLAVIDKEREKMNEQFLIRKYIFMSSVLGERYLRVLYHHQNDDASIEAEVKPLLLQVGTDPASIDFLLGKTRYNPDPPRPSTVPALSR